MHGVLYERGNVSGLGTESPFILRDVIEVLMLMPLSFRCQDNPMPYLASHRERKRSLWDFSSVLLAEMLSAGGMLGAAYCSSVAEFHGNSWRITGVVRKASSPA